jgi:molybdopterin-guanine dinucleotide biosynthesis protein A
VYHGVSLMLFHMTQPKLSRMGFVLAGGKSSRMGTDKAFLEFGGQTLLDRAIAEMGMVCSSVAIVGDPVKFAKYGAPKYEPVVADIFHGCGPLAGIHAALVHSTAELNVMLAVDMPFVSTELLAFLLTKADEDDAIVTVPRIGKGLQPLCAVYRPSFCITAEQALRAGNYKVDAAFSGISIRVIEEDELTAAGFSERLFFNVNTPQDALHIAPKSNSQSKVL